MKRLINFLLSLLYVPKCVRCGRSLCPETVLCLCEACRKEIPDLGELQCDKCGRPISGSGPDHFCASCRFTRYHFERIFAASLYQGLMRRSLILYKFYHKTSYAKTFALLIAERYREIGFSGTDVITYVPLHPKRLRKRGFHQTQMLAEFVGEALELPVKPLLKKIRNTKPQSSMKGKDRLKNVRGSFEALSEDEIKGRHVLLIDDIATTGMTTDECARILKRSGAKTVNVGVVAVTPQNKG